ncbi:hypothetical protein RHORCCE3_2059 [Rickettsia hoogstraalii str. RCCE3]|nr:hypothetical protein RHORCCE3_2059 [Rickettsia hoogstraalii str. RCCE3]
MRCKVGNDLVLSAIRSLTKVLIWIGNRGKVKLKLVKRSESLFGNIVNIKADTPDNICYRDKAEKLSCKKAHATFFKNASSPV